MLVMMRAVYYRKITKTSFSNSTHEIEKAHPEVFNILLQVMDHGTLTDNNGRKAAEIVSLS